MNGSFWSNTIWYIALSATSIAAIVIIFIKTPARKKTFAFYFAVLGFTYCIEISLLLILDAYTYYPMIVEEEFFDAVLGNIFSQASVSSSAVLICVLHLSNWWLAGFAAAYFLIDILFSRLGIYVHYWYRSIYTLAGFLVYGGIVKYWYKKIFNFPSKRIYYPTLVLSIFAITGNILGTALKLLGIRIFQSGLVSDPSRDHTITALIYGPIMTILSIALYKWKIHRSQKALVFLLLLICQYGLVQSGIIVVEPGWWVFVILLDLLVYYSWTLVMDKSLCSAANNKRIKIKKGV
ncbi:MAG: hypothetical protein ACYCX2_04360 [Christensenellales bacterium]